MASVLGIIPARGGSKRVPRKNLRLLGGKPLIAWTIEEAKKSKLITYLLVSTEDDEIIQAASLDYRCNVLQRPEELATDEASSLDVVRHAVSAIPGYNYVCLLQPTSPFRTAADIDGCIEAAMCVGHCITTSTKHKPNGAVYVWSSRHIHDGYTCFVEMPLSRSIDIDTESDFAEAERAIQVDCAA